MFWKKKKESKWTCEQLPETIKQPPAIIISPEELCNDLFIRTDYVLEPERQEIFEVTSMGYYLKDGVKTNIYIRTQDFKASSGQRRQ